MQAGSRKPLVTEPNAILDSRGVFAAGRTALNRLFKLFTTGLWSPGTLLTSAEVMLMWTGGPVGAAGCGGG